MPTITKWGYQAGVISGCFLMFRFHIHSRICHFRFKFIRKLNEGYTGVTIQVTLCSRPSIINAVIPEQEARFRTPPTFRMSTACDYS